MNSLLDGLILVDRRGRIAYANPRAEEMLGLPAGTLGGRTLEAVEQRITDRVAGWEQIRRLLENTAEHPPNTPAVELVLAAPESHTLQARPFPIYDSSGANLGPGILLRDITSEERLDEMKSQLLSTVSQRIAHAPGEHQGVCHHPPCATTSVG